MGEYAVRTADGQRVKIGTCESLMDGLRPDQMDAVIYPHFTSETLKHFLFRFPFPSEDKTLPGDFAGYPHGLAVWGIEPPRDIAHYKVQFKADAGILLSVPCPRGTEAVEGLKVHYNGYRGPVAIVGQRARDGVWTVVAKCGDCGTLYSHGDLESAQPMIDALRKRAQEERMRDRDSATAGRIYDEVAERIEAGYSTPVRVPARV